MKRIKIALPKKKPIFTYSLTLRVDDMNYGNHLGNDSVLKICHQARVCFLKEYNQTELNCFGEGIIMVDSHCNYKSQAYMHDKLKVEVFIEDIDNTGLDFYYSLMNTSTKKVVANVKTGILFYNYENQKVAQVPELFREKFS